MIKHADRAPEVSPTLPALDESHNMVMNDDTGHDMAEDCMLHLLNFNLPTEPIKYKRWQYTQIECCILNVY